MHLFAKWTSSYNHAHPSTSLHRRAESAVMFRHYVAVALRNIRSSPFASVVNVATLAVGLVCFVTAYAAGTFWSTAERQFRNVDDIHVLTITIKNRDNGLGFR